VSTVLGVAAGWGVSALEAIGAGLAVLLMPQTNHVKTIGVVHGQVIGSITAMAGSRAEKRTGA